jgi:hypothetical protein
MNLLGPGTSVTVAADLPVTLRWAIPRRAHGCTQAPCEFANAMLRPAGPVPTQMRACPGANVAARVHRHNGRQSADADTAPRFMLRYAVHSNPVPETNGARQCRGTCRRSGRRDSACHCTGTRRICAQPGLTVPRHEHCQVSAVPLGSPTAASPCAPRLASGLYAGSEDTTAKFPSWTGAHTVHAATQSAGRLSLQVLRPAAQRKVAVAGGARSSRGVTAGTPLDAAHATQYTRDMWRSACDVRHDAQVTPALSEARCTMLYDPRGVLHMPRRARQVEPAMRPSAGRPEEAAGELSAPCQAG